MAKNAKNLRKNKNNMPNTSFLMNQQKKSKFMKILCKISDKNMILSINLHIMKDINNKYK